MLNMKDEFLSIASHELQTPITSVRASLQIVERFATDKENMKQLQPFVEKASKQVNKLIVIIRNLLDVSRIQSGRIQVNKTAFVLTDIIDDLKEQSKLLAAGHTI